MGKKSRKRKKPLVLKEVIDSIEQTIQSYNQSEKELKKQYLITKWIKEWNAFIQFEEKFNPMENMKYTAGQIIEVNFGYNVGSEQGGVRPAVVIEDNDNSSKVVTVIPLSSLKGDKTKEDVEKKENVFLGVIEGYYEVFPNIDREIYESVAEMSQIRSVSKIRIQRPKKREHKGSNLKLNPLLLKKIYDAITERYTKYGLEAKVPDHTVNQGINIT